MEPSSAADSVLVRRGLEQLGDRRAVAEWLSLPVEDSPVDALLELTRRSAIRIDAD